MSPIRFDPAQRVVRRQFTDLRSHQPPFAIHAAVSPLLGSEA
jgi:hypothetical protein